MAETLESLLKWAKNNRFMCVQYSDGGGEIDCGSFWITEPSLRQALLAAKRDMEKVK